MGHFQVVGDPFEFLMFHKDSPRHSSSGETSTGSPWNSCKHFPLAKQWHQFKHSAAPGVSTQTREYLHCVLSFLLSSLFHLNYAVADLHQGLNYRSTECHKYVFLGSQFSWVKGRKKTEKTWQTYSGIFNKDKNTYLVEL